MKEAEFVANRSENWRRLSAAFGLLEKGKLPHGGARDLPLSFRQLCADLAMAKQRMYSRRLIDQLNDEVIRGNRLLHQSTDSGWSTFIHWVLVRFPRAFREEWHLFVFCSLAFWLPFGLMMWSAYADFDWIERMLGPVGMAQMDAMYGKGSDWDEAVRAEFGSRFYMFGHYIMNNVGIDFRIFAGGALAGVGALIVLFFNGLYIGAAAGYCTVVGDAQKFWYFVCGHSAPELTGMVICGMAGMRVGLSWLRPGRLRRVDALRDSRRTALPLLLGGALLTALAAPIEAFWSSMSFAPFFKILFGLSLWVLVHAFLILSGRGAYAD